MKMENPRDAVQSVAITYTSRNALNDPRERPSSKFKACQTRGSLRPYISMYVWTLKSAGIQISAQRNDKSVEFSRVVITLNSAKTWMKRSRVDDETRELLVRLEGEDIL